MSEDKTLSDGRFELRRRAEEALQGKSIDVQTLSVEEIHRLIHELQVHQIELEMQNEALRQTQQHLETARDQYSDLYDFSPLGYFSIAETGLILQANFTGAALLGVQRRFLIGMPFFRFVARQDQDRYYRHRKQVYALQDRQSCELKMVKGDGTQFYGQMESVGLRGRDGSMSHMRTVISEITERKRAEDALRINEKRCQDLYDNAPDMYFTIAEDGTVLAVNRFGADCLGFAKKELVGGPVWGVVHPEDLAQIQQQVAEIFKQRLQKSELEFRKVRKDGSVLWVHERVRCIAGREGGPAELQIVCRDITERKRAEREMTRLRLKLNSIIDSMPSILVGVDPKGRITAWNLQAEKATGIASDQAQGRLFGEVFSQLEGQLEQVRLAIRSREPITAKRIAHVVNGDTHYADVMVYPLIENGSEGAVIRVDDVTARVRIEQMMVQTEKMLSVGGLAAGMAHEINNPLSAITQACQNIVRRLSPELPRNQEIARALGLKLAVVGQYLEERGIPRFLDDIQEAGARAAKIVADMLAFSRRSEALMGPANLSRLLDTAVRLAASDYDLKKHYDFKHIRIEREYDPSLDEVPCDAIALEQVILNLLKNAAHAMALNQSRHPSKIILRTVKEKAYARIEVIDNGPGMIEATRKRAFEPFFTTKEVGIGTGLGLSVSYFIVTEQHKGTMAVESSPGQGARFIIRLPLLRAVDT